MDNYNLTEVINFPHLSISHSDADRPIEISLLLAFESDTSVNQLEPRIAKVAFPAAIESVARGKSREIERALNLIDSNGAFCLPPYSYKDKKEFEVIPADGGGD